MKGQSQKETEVAFTLQPTQMGVRVYIPTLGRFSQTDSVKGGTPNDYVYPTDPVNQEDLNGMKSQRGINKGRSVGFTQEEMLAEQNRSMGLKWDPGHYRSYKEKVKRSNKLNLKKPSRITKDLKRSRGGKGVAHLEGVWALPSGLYLGHQLCLTTS